MLAQQPAANKTWTPPKTPWGEPDLQGMWPLNHLISTPFQRQQKYGDRRLMTDEEFAAAQKSAQARNQRFESGAIPQADSGTQVMRLTSLISDPPDGRFPALTPKGKALYDQMHGSYKPGQTVFDSPADFDSWDRCITRGMPVSMLPRNYNNGIRIMQFPGYVVIPSSMGQPDGGECRDRRVRVACRWVGMTACPKAKGTSAPPATAVRS
jgi:hypothetical protein